MSDEDDDRLIALMRGTEMRDRAEPTSAALAARILVDFDATRRARWHLSLLVDAVWPGAPAWKPAVALGLSLMIGLGVGALLPVYGFAEDAGTVSDASPGLDFGGDLR